jgi:xylulokinase
VVGLGSRKPGDKYIIAHDVGSSGDKAVLTDLLGKILFTSYQPYNMIFPAIGLAEQDPDLLWNAVLQTTHDLVNISGIDTEEIAGVGISAQMFNLVPVDDEYRPLTNMITWMDLRALKQADRFIEQVGVEQICKWTGNIPNGKDIIPKILWLMEERPDLWKRVYKLLDCKEYLIYRLTGRCAIDWHGATVFMLFDPANKTWSKEACSALGISNDILPETLPCTAIVGEVQKEPAKKMGIKAGLPVVICAGDVGVAQVGAGTVQEGYANLYIGTGGWIGVSSKNLVNNPKCPFWALNHVLSECWIIAADLDTAGGSLMWFRDQLCLEEIEKANSSGISVYQILSEMAAQIQPGADKLLFFPWLSGERGHLGIGHYAKGGFVGLAFGHTKSHMVRAIMEGVAFHYRWMIDTIEQSGVDIKVIKAIGGGCKGATWLQIMSDVLNRELQVIKSPQEAGSVGAALTTAAGLGFFPVLEDADSLIQVDHTVIPKTGQFQRRYEELYAEYVELGSELQGHFKSLSKVI